MQNGDGTINFSPDFLANELGYIVEYIKECIPWVSLEDIQKYAKMMMKINLDEHFSSILINGNNSKLKREEIFDIFDSSKIPVWYLLLVDVPSFMSVRKIKQRGVYMHQDILDSIQERHIKLTQKVYDEEKNPKVLTMISKPYTK